MEVMEVVEVVEVGLRTENPPVYIGLLTWALSDPSLAPEWHQL